MPPIRKRCIAVLVAASLVGGAPLGFSGPAAADRYRPHGAFYSYHYGGYRPYYRAPYRHGYHGHSGASVGVHGHGSRGAAIAVALGAGLLLGYLLTRQQVGAAPPFGYGERVARNCKPTTGRGLYQGRPAMFGGTFCYDAAGQGYVVPGSAFLIGYVD